MTLVSIVLTILIFALLFSIGVLYFAFKRYRQGVREDFEAFLRESLKDIDEMGP